MYVSSAPLDHIDTLRDSLLPQLPERVLTRGEMFRLLAKSPTSAAGELYRAVLRRRDKKKPTAAKSSRKTRMFDGFLMGFEFEFRSRLPHEETCAFLKEAIQSEHTWARSHAFNWIRGYHMIKRVKDQWIVESDGSIRVTKEHSVAVEFVTPPLSYTRLSAVLPTILRAIKSLGSTDASCGLHFTVGNQGFAYAGNIDACALVKMLDDRAVVAHFGRSENHYCSPYVGTSDLTPISRKPTEPGEKVNHHHLYFLSRTMSVNFTKLDRGLIELRAMGGDYVSKLASISCTMERFLWAVCLSYSPTRNLALQLIGPLRKAKDESAYRFGDAFERSIATTVRADVSVALSFGSVPDVFSAYIRPYGTYGDLLYVDGTDVWSHNVCTISSAPDNGAGACFDAGFANVRVRLRADIPRGVTPGRHVFIDVVGVSEISRGDISDLLKLLRILRSDLPSLFTCTTSVRVGTYVLNAVVALVSPSDKVLRSFVSNHIRDLTLGLTGRVVSTTGSPLTRADLPGIVNLVLADLQRIIPCDELPTCTTTQMYLGLGRALSTDFSSVRDHFISTVGTDYLLRRAPEHILNFHAALGRCATEQHVGTYAELQTAFQAVYDACPDDIPLALQLALVFPLRRSWNIELLSALAYRTGRRAHQTPSQLVAYACSVFVVMSLVNHPVRQDSTSPKVRQHDLQDFVKGLSLLYDIVPGDHPSHTFGASRFGVLKVLFEVFDCAPFSSYASCLEVDLTTSDNTVRLSATTKEILRFCHKACCAGFPVGVYRAPDWALLDIHRCFVHARVAQRVFNLPPVYTLPLVRDFFAAHRKIIPTQRYSEQPQTLKGAGLAILDRIAHEVYGEALTNVLRGNRADTVRMLACSGEDLFQKHPSYTYIFGFPPADYLRQFHSKLSKIQVRVAPLVWLPLSRVLTYASDEPSTAWYCKIPGYKTFRRIFRFKQSELYGADKFAAVLKRSTRLSYGPYLARDVDTKQVFDITSQSLCDALSFLHQ